jgi:cytochrome oxidase assembly protein ShyY1
MRPPPGRSRSTKRPGSAAVSFGSYRQGVWKTLREPRYVVLLVIAIGVAIGCCFAGVWQIHRYYWKHDSNTELRDNDHHTPVPVGQLLSTSKQATKIDQFRRVTATGVYQPKQQLLVRNREVNDSPALLVLTPLRTDAGPTLLVVRGWLPVTKSAGRSPHVPAPPTGRVSVTVRVFPSEPMGATGTPPAGQINRLNVPMIAHRLKVPTYGGYAALISASAGSKLQQLPPPDMSNPTGGAFELQHLAYVGQWFLFAIIAMGAPFALARIERLRGTHAPAEIAAPVSNSASHSV